MAVVDDSRDGRRFSGSGGPWIVDDGSDGQDATSWKPRDVGEQARGCRPVDDRDAASDALGDDRRLRLRHVDRL